VVELELDQEKVDVELVEEAWRKAPCLQKPLYHSALPERSLHQLLAAAGAAKILVVVVVVVNPVVLKLII
jgi:hypothetical protein